MSFGDWAGAIGNIGSALITSGASLWATNKSNKASKNAQQRQIGWEDYWSNTSVQRRMEDLEKAGINPMLAGDLTATTPGAGVYSAQTADMSSLANINPFDKKLQNDQTKATTEATEQTGKKAEAEAEQTRKMTPVLEKQANSATAKNIAEKAEAEARGQLTKQQADWNKEHPTAYSIGQYLDIVGKGISAAAQIGNVAGTLMKGSASLKMADKPAGNHTHYHYKD